MFLGVTQILSVGEVVEIAVVMKPVSVVAEAYLSFEFEDLDGQQDQVQASQQEDVVAVVIYSSDPASFQFEEQRDRCPRKKDKAEDNLEDYIHSDYFGDVFILVSVVIVHMLVVALALCKLVLVVQVSTYVGDVLVLLEERHITALGRVAVSVELLVDSDYI